MKVKVVSSSLQSKEIIFNTSTIAVVLLLKQFAAIPPISSWSFGWSGLSGRDREVDEENEVDKEAKEEKDEETDKEVDMGVD